MTFSFWESSNPVVRSSLRKGCSPTLDVGLTLNPLRAWSQFCHAVSGNEDSVSSRDTGGRVWVLAQPVSLRLCTTTIVLPNYMPCFPMSHRALWEQWCSTWLCLGCGSSNGWWLLGSLLNKRKTISRIWGRGEQWDHIEAKSNSMFFSSASRLGTLSVWILDILLFRTKDTQLG